MSSHDMSIRSNIHVKPGLTLSEIWAVLATFADEFRSALDGDANLIEATGQIPFVDVDNEVTLDDDDNLYLYLSFHGSAGVAPEWVENLLDQLNFIVAPGGATVEIIDHDTSASNYEAMMYRYLGSDENEQRRARVTHGLEQAEETLVGVLGVDGFERISELARQLGEERIATQVS